MSPVSQATDEPAKRRHPTKQPWRLVRLANLQDAALLLLLLAGEQRGARCVLEHFADAFVGLGRALEVLERADLLADVFGLLRSHGLLRSLVQLLDGLLVVAQVLLAADEDDGQALTEVQNLGNPLLLDVVERIGRVNGEADEDNMRVGVRKRAETVVILLTGGIP